jgi:hypothetical protein
MVRFTLDDVYQKFGMTAEAAQLLETQLGTMLLLIRGSEEGLFFDPNTEIAADLYRVVNRRTLLGQLIKEMGDASQSLDTVETLLSNALQERNRLFHSFYRQHNFRRNSEEGRAIMWTDLDHIHDTIILAYKAVMLIDGTDIDALTKSDEHNGPRDHVQI